MSLHEPVVLELTIDNRLPQPIIVNLGRNYVGELHMTLTRPDGSTVTADTLRPRRTESEAIVMAKIKVSAGTPYTRSVVLNRWLPFDRIGRHRLDVRFSGEAWTESEQTVDISTRAVPLTVEVVPRSEKRLREFCQKWLDVLERGRTGDDAMVASEALYSVDDPVAVDYITVAIKTPMGDSSEGFRALERIGTDEAIKALEKLAQHPHGDIREYAKETLAKIEARRKQG